MGNAANTAHRPGVRPAEEATGPREGFGAPDCHVIVERSSEVIQVAERPLVEAGAPTERGAAFLRLADQHLDSAYRLARAILRDAAEAQDATHDAFVQAWQKWATLH